MRKIWIPTMLLWASILQAKSITWIYVDFSPYYILDGIQKGLGRDENVVQMLAQVMPEYKFNHIVFPASRAIKELSDPSNIYCMVSLYKTVDRQKHIAYTNEVSTIGLSPSMAIRKSSLQTLNLEPGQQASLKELLKKHKLTLGIAYKRSFGTEIDKIIKNTDEDQIIIRPGKDPLVGLTGMLIKSRIDIALGYPSEHFHLQQILDHNYELSQLTIKETNNFAHGYIGCTKRDETHELLNDLDIALKQIKTSRKYNDTMLYWLPTELQPTLTSKLFRQPTNTPPDS